MGNCPEDFVESSREFCGEVLIYDALCPEAPGVVSSLQKSVTAAGAAGIGGFVLGTGTVVGDGAS